MLTSGVTSPHHGSHSRDSALAPWERWAGHAGYVAEGVFYLPLGFFALLAAVGRQQPNGSSGALARVGGSLLGDALLALLAAGLVAFVVWQLVVAIADPEYRAQRGSTQRRLVRLGHCFSAAFHCAFVIQAVWSIFGPSRPIDEKESQVRWTARMFQLPAGRVLVAIAGAGIVIFGLWQFYRALTADKNKRVELRRTRFRLAISALGAYGLAARGTLFCLVGGYLVNACWRGDPRYSGGIAGALSGLKQQSYGEWLLGVMAVGLLCYGLYQIVKEPYRKLSKS